jgi:ketosteroid isomerase-like protein
LLLLGSLGCTAQAPVTVPTVDPRTTIASAWGQFKTAVLAGDANAATAAVFSETAVTLGQDAPDCNGRAEIAKTLSDFLSEHKVTAVEQRTDEIEISGDLAYERGASTQTFRRGNKAPETQTTRYLAVWKLQSDGSWKIHRLAKH